MTRLTLFRLRDICSQPGLIEFPVAVLAAVEKHHRQPVAELAAEAMLDGQAVSQLPRRFARLWRSRRFGCRAAALSVSMPVIRDTVLRPGMPALAVQVAMRVMGK